MSFTKFGSDNKQCQILPLPMQLMPLESARIGHFFV